MRNYPVISERTFKESPHLRDMPVLPTDVLNKGDVLVCSVVGEPRHPPASDDKDVEGVCHKCGVGVIHRASAPKLPLECWRCYRGMNG